MVLVLWKGRTKRAISWEQDGLILVTTIGSHVSNLLFTVIGGYWNILPLTAPIAPMVLYIYHKGRKYVPIETF